MTLCDASIFYFLWGSEKEAKKFNLVTSSHSNLKRTVNGYAIFYPLDHNFCNEFESELGK